MIRRVTVHNFKRFSSQEFDLSESVVLAGPNNAGKSTLLQAIATWKFAVDRWVAGRGQRGGQYKSVPITRNDFTAVPLREMNLLWTDRTVSGGGIRRTLTPTRAAPPGASRPIGIHVEGGGRHGDWRCGIELRYANREMVYVRPAPLHEDGREETFPPQGARDIDVVHVPPLSGIRRDMSGACRICSWAKRGPVIFFGICCGKSPRPTQMAGNRWCDTSRTCSGWNCSGPSIPRTSHS